MPYDQYLKRFPAYLQQLTMESNGKHVTLTGRHVDYDTGAVYWGEPGTNGQHSFYQLIHQGTMIIPVDLIGFARGAQPASATTTTCCRRTCSRRRRRWPSGRPKRRCGPRGRRTRVVPHRVMEGNRPTNTLLCDILTPRLLGSLVALYEHSVFVQGTIWEIDSFDQWGVELGKVARPADHPRAGRRRRSQRCRMTRRRTR